MSVIGLSHALVRGANAVMGGMTAPTTLSPPPTDSSYVQVQDTNNDYSLYEKSADTAFDYPASLVKHATALILMERKGAVLDTETATVASSDIVGGTTANLEAGDVLTWRDLLYGLLVPSGNDAAECIARVLGTEIFNETSTGDTGGARFVEEMNAKASSWGLSATTFNSPHGVSTATYSSGGSNPTTARDMAILAKAAYADSTIRAVAISVSQTMTITGTNARTYSISQAVKIINGPPNNQSGLTMAGVLAGKGGLATSPTNYYNLAILWQAPAGQEIVIVTMGSTTAEDDRYLDVTGIIFQILDDFPYLVSGVDIGTDADFANVSLLTGGASGFIDDSSYAHTLTAGGATLTTTDTAMGSQSFLLDGINDFISTPHAAELTFGSGDWTIEFWFCGNGSEPANLATMIGIWDNTHNKREWDVEYESSVGLGAIVGEYSTTGSDFISSSLKTTDGDLSISPATFFNGARRHILARRDGTEVATYVNGWKGGFTAGAGTVFSSTAKLMIGCRDNGSSGVNFIGGTIGEIRVTKGVARQTAAMFTPSGRPYPRS